jgi:hypothetical protein
MVLFQPQNQHVTKAFDLTGKVAVVTGALIHNKKKRKKRERERKGVRLTSRAGGSRGIGLEVSRGLAEAGADVPLPFQLNNLFAIYAKALYRLQ